MPACTLPETRARSRMPVRTLRRAFARQLCLQLSAYSRLGTHHVPACGWVDAQAAVQRAGVGAGIARRIEADALAVRAAALQRLLRHALRARCRSVMIVSVASTQP